MSHGIVASLASLSRYVWLDVLVPPSSRTVRAVRSVQRGTIAIVDPDTSETASVTATDSSRLAHFYTGHHTNVNSENFSPLLTLSGTTLTAARTATTAGANTTVGYTVVEYY